ncbi:sulfite exporter TauE/SafE family protein [Acidovorax sp. LjRoot66]|uniref:sulfite exporter TauE/SafE family protein n=1 Tax=Acidovorax sp. LjRoot66 TaxID=3342334 RepID=UPI003ECCF802
MEFYLVLAVFGTLAGVTTVLFGFGGGFVVVPVLYRTLVHMHGSESPLGQSAMQVAVATSTCVMIVGAGLATRRHQRAGNVDWAQVRPLLAFIAVGAVAGAAAATVLRSDWVRWTFVAYLALTILDGLLRPGFIRPRAAVATPQDGTRPSGPVTALLGLAIGAVASFLGVGGSVMTVPLMRRRGAPMVQATAAANPLSLPVALAGTATYVLLAWEQAAPLGAWHAGFVDLRAFAVLVAGSWLGIRLGGRFVGRLPDGLHAKVYLALLAVVLLAMLMR